MEDSVTEDERLLQSVDLCSKEEVEVVEKKEQKAEVEDNDKRKGTMGDEEKGGGLLNHIISGFVSSPKAAEGNNGRKFDSVVETGKKDEEGSKPEEEIDTGGGGIIKNVISNLFHSSEDHQVMENEESDNEEKETVKTEEDNDRNGIIDNIVSHLPSSFEEVAVAPTTDEASILIHSIIHD